MSQIRTGLSGLLMSMAKTSLPVGPTDPINTVCQSRRFVPAISINTSMYTGDASTRALFPFTPGSWVEGMKDQSSVPTGGVVPLANCEAQLVAKTFPLVVPARGELAGRLPGGKETVVEGPV